MLALKAKIQSILAATKVSESPETEAEQILFHVFRRQNPKIKTITDLRLITEELLPSFENEAIEIASARAEGRPLQHILGTQFFFEHEYQVNDSTLIPRPETEILVKTAIDWIFENCPDRPFQFAELGLGSGAITGEILSVFKLGSCIASETSIDAIALAQANLSRILGAGFERRVFIFEPTNPEQGFEAFVGRGQFDFIISNPPYLSKGDEIAHEVLKHEPKSALFPILESGEDNPNYFYENFLLHGTLLLKPGAACFFEVPHERAQEIYSLFKDAGFSSVELIPDLTGRPRVIKAIS